MEETPTGQPVFDALVPPGDQPSSIVDRLRKQREAAMENRTVDLDVPGYGGDLFIRYGQLDTKTLSRMGDNILKTEKDRVQRAILVAMDVLIAACEGVYVRDNGQEVGVHEILGDEAPVRFDMRLAEWLKFVDELPETPTARSIVMKLFIDNELAIGAQSQVLQRWMVSNENKLSEELMAGEF